MPANSGESQALAVRNGSANKAQKAVQPEPDDEDHYGSEDSDDESDNGDFPNHDKMPAQHPATRTTSQLMGMPATSSMSKTADFFLYRAHEW